MNIIKTILLVSVTSVFVACSSTKSQTVNNTTTSSGTLKDAYKGKFYIGTALNLHQIWERNDKAKQVIETHFNSIVAENCMKSENMQPQEGVFNFKDSDRYVKYGEKHGMQHLGHTLSWHSQARSRYCKHAKGHE